MTIPAAAGSGAAAPTSPDSAPSAPAAAGASGGAAGAPASTAAAGAAAPAAGSGGAPASSDEHEDLGMGDGSDVITVGDSWMSYAINGGGIETGLLAASGQRYRTYGVAGTMLLDEVIPNQYETAKRQNPDIKTVVMTGGGNDLLLTGMTAGGCGEGCKSTIDKVTQRLVEMWDEMAADGVQDVIYIEYSRGGTNEPGVSYANEVIPPKCAAAPVRCHFIDSDIFIMKQLIDGVHPTADGCQKLGKAAFDLMVEKGMRR
jgi:lysophospholipase L1-like esterase